MDACQHINWSFTIKYKPRNTSLMSSASSKNNGSSVSKTSCGQGMSLQKIKVTWRGRKQMVLYGAPEIRGLKITRKSKRSI